MACSMYVFRYPFFLKQRYSILAPLYTPSIKKKNTTQGLDIVEIMKIPLWTDSWWWQLLVGLVASCQMSGRERFEILFFR